MSEQLLQTILSYLTIIVAVVAGLLLALWLSLVVWAYRDMRLRSRDPFAYILTPVRHAALPWSGFIPCRAALAGYLPVLALARKVE